MDVDMEWMDVEYGMCLLSECLMCFW